MRTAYWTGLTLAVGLALIYLFQGYYFELMGFLSNIFTILLSAATMVMSSLLLRRYWGKPRERFSTVWVSFTLGMIFSFLASLSWAIYVLLLGISIPYPSLADAFFLINYAFLIIAFYTYVKIFRLAISSRMLKTAVVIIVVASATIFVVMAPSLIRAENTQLTLILDITYLSFDLVLFTLTILGLLIFVKGKIGKVWLLFNGAILTLVIGDVFLTYATMQGTYYSGHFVDLIYCWVYFLALLALYTHMKEL